MSWSVILADLGDVLKTINAGKGISQALKEHGLDECMLYFKCGLCGTDTYMKIKPVIDRHLVGQKPTLPSRCSEDNCNGSCSYDGIYKQ